MTIVGRAVQMTSRRVLPWVGGPSSSSSPGRMCQRQMLKRTTVATPTKIGTDTITSTSQNVSILDAIVDPCAGNQLIASPSAMPIALASRTTTTSITQVRPVTGPRRVSSPICPATYRLAGTARNDVRGCWRARLPRALAAMLARGDERAL